MARVSLVLATLAALILVVAASTSGEFGPLTVEPSVHVGRFDPSQPLFRSHEAPSLAPDHQDRSTLYLASVEMGSGRCRFHVSTDRGATWRPETAPSLEPYTHNCAMGSALPQNIRTDLVQGPDGTLYYAFQGNDPEAGGTRSVLLARSTDGGRSWSTVPVYAGPRAAAPEEVELNFMAHVAVDPDDGRRVYVTWRRSYPLVDGLATRPTRGYLAVSENGGQSFGAARLMFDRLTGFDGPRLLVVGGRLYAFYLDPTTPPASPNPSPTPIGTRASVAISPDRGQTWEHVEIAMAPSTGEPMAVWDARRGRFYAVWHGSRDGDLDVYVSVSADGRSWSAPRKLNDDPPGTRVGQHFPDISISRSGRVDVAWYDWRDDPFPPPTSPNNGPLTMFGNRGKMASVYLTSSDDGGETWLPNVRVSDQLIDRTIGTWAENFDVLVPPSVASLHDRAVVAWSDTRNGTVESQAQDIYTGTVVFPHLEGRMVNNLQAGLAGLLLGGGSAMWAAVWLMRRQGRGRGRGPAGRTGARNAPEPARFAHQKG